MTTKRNAISAKSIWNRRGAVESTLLLGMTIMLVFVAWLFQLAE